MLLSQKYRVDFWTALLGCLLVGLIIGLAATCIAGYWLGWLAVFWIVGVATSFSFLLALYGLAELFITIGELPGLVIGTISEIYPSPADP